MYSDINDIFKSIINQCGILKKVHYLYTNIIKMLYVWLNTLISETTSKIKKSFLFWILHLSRKDLLNHIVPEISYVRHLDVSYIF